MRRSLLFSLALCIAGAGLPSNVAAAGPPAVDARPSLSTAPGSLLSSYARTLFDDALTARPADRLFFPLPAYEQVKAISDPAADYTHRLLYGFHLDMAALHAHLRRSPTPVFLRALLNPTALTWVEPGTCGNRLGYWHLPGLRLVYRVGTTVYSVAVVSMISWRGRLYVIHLGSFIPTPPGVVAQPAVGPGYPWPAGGC